MFKHNQFGNWFRRFALVILGAVLPLAPIGAATQWGTFLSPFAVDSLWNARPLNPVLGDATIPLSTYFPDVTAGPYSTGMFLSTLTDPPVVVEGLPGKPGVWDPDSETNRPSVTIPHWPADVSPAIGEDGHADIVDANAGIIHSFWQLKFVGGKWIAAQYAWSRLNGSGWGDPAHYFQGSRATGVPTSAGLIRKHEINDGESIYHHALAMSLTFNGLSKNPTYVFPATSADDTAATTNTGLVPEGSLMMLPPTYNTAQIADLALRKIAETLKVYGAYVVDRNYGTPFVIYVEKGSGFNLHSGGWNVAVANELDRIRANLRPVVSAQAWLDGNGNNFEPQRKFNLLSMRGPWMGSPASGVFDTWQQAVVFPSTDTPIVQYNDTSRGLNKILWALPQTGDSYRLKAIATGGAKLRFQIKDTAGVTRYDSGALVDSQEVVFAWPVDNAKTFVYAVSGVGGISSVRGELVKVTP